MLLVSRAKRKQHCTHQIISKSIIGFPKLLTVYLPKPIESTKNSTLNVNLRTNIQGE